MLWHITKREIYDHLTSLRFALTVGLVLMLMLMNAVIFIGSDYSERLNQYSQNVNREMESVRQSCNNLSELAREGPGNFYKRPSPLAFCATGHDDILPGQVSARLDSTISSWGYYWKEPWRLSYPPEKAQINPMIKQLTELDWSFIIGIVMSFVAILFTFDAISGERERGTLALVMSNAVPKGVVLFGKFLGAFITLAIPMLLGILLSLLIVNLSGSISLASGEWARIGFIVLISFFYISIFIGLGLTISSRLGSNTSLLMSLLIWVVIVVLTPNTLGAIVSTLRKVPSISEVKRQKDAILKEIDERLLSKDKMFQFGSPSDKPPNEKALRHWADYITGKTEAESRFDDAHLARQFAQIDFARKILRVSPAIIYNYALESLAGTGFERHRRFVAAVQRYRQQFIDFIKMTDRGDSSSPHIYYIKEGLSQKPVDFAGVPKFEEGFSAEAAFRSSLIDLITLVLFGMLLFLLSYVAFLRCEVR